MRNPTAPDLALQALAAENVALRARIDSLEHSLEIVTDISKIALAKLSDVTRDRDRLDGVNLAQRKQLAFLLGADVAREAA